VPTKLFEGAGLESSSDSWYGCVRGDDNLAELGVGRVPVGTVAEVAAWAERVLSVENGAAIPSSPLASSRGPIHWGTIPIGAADAVLWPSSTVAAPLAPRTRTDDCAGVWAWRVARETAQAQASLQALLHVTLLGDPALRLARPASGGRHTESGVGGARSDSADRYGEIVRLLDGGPTGAAPDPVDAPAASSALADYKLIAVMGAGDERWAIVQDEGGRQTMLRAGQLLGEARVAKIEADSLALECDGRTVEIRLE